MLQCTYGGDFTKHFTDNMKALGLPVPTTLFDSFTSAIANAAIMLETLSTLGSKATVAELIGATTKLEGLKVAGALVASLYVGAVIGSIGVAATKSLTCGMTLTDIFDFQSRYNLKFKGSHQFYATYPEILAAKYRNQSTYWTKAIAKAN